MRKSRLVVAALGAATIAAAILPTTASAVPALSGASTTAAHQRVAPAAQPASAAMRDQRTSVTHQRLTARDLRAARDRLSQRRGLDQRRGLQRRSLDQRGNLDQRRGLSQRDRMLLRRNVTPRDLIDLRRHLSARDVSNLRNQLTAWNRTLPGQYRYAAILRPVPTNNVHAVGFARVWTQGRFAHVVVVAFGLQRNSPHAMHIHVNGAGQCPGPGRATNHNGHMAISTTDGAPDYGPVGTSLTTAGDAGPTSVLAVSRFKQTGNFLYNRTIPLTNTVRNNLRHHKAVVVVHGIDYNSNGAYDTVLGSSELDSSLPQEATAPALCGALH